MAARLLGAFIHEEVDTATDRQIALQLYKDAHALLQKTYRHYPSLKGEQGEALKRLYRPTDFKTDPEVKAL